MKALLIFAPEQVRLPRAEQQQHEAADECPRTLLLEDTLNADVIDGLYLQIFQSRSIFRRFIGKYIPPAILQVLIVYKLRQRYDVVVSWDDRFALIYAFLLRLTRSRSRHVAILSWMPPPKKAFMLKMVQKGIDRIILWSQTQGISWLSSLVSLLKGLWSFLILWIRTSGDRWMKSLIVFARLATQTAIMLLLSRRCVDSLCHAMWLRVFSFWNITRATGEQQARVWRRS